MNIPSASSPFLSQVIVLLFLKRVGYNNNRLPQVRNTRNRSNPGYRKYRPAFYNNQNGDKFADPMNTGFYRLFPKIDFHPGYRQTIRKIITDIITILRPENISIIASLGYQSHIQAIVFTRQKFFAGFAPVRHNDTNNRNLPKNYSRPFAGNNTKSRMTGSTRYRIEAITYLWKLQCRFPDKPSGLRTIFHDLTSSQNP